MAGNRIISADDRVFEPVGLWTTRAEPRFRDRAPRIVRTEDGGDWWICDGHLGLGAFSGAPGGHEV